MQDSLVAVKMAAPNKGRLQMPDVEGKGPPPRHNFTFPPRFSQLLSTGSLAPFPSSSFSFFLVGLDFLREMRAPQHSSRTKAHIDALRRLLSFLLTKRKEKGEPLGMG